MMKVLFKGGKTADVNDSLALRLYEQGKAVKVTAAEASPRLADDTDGGRIVSAPADDAADTAAEDTDGNGNPSSVGCADTFPTGKARGDKRKKSGKE